MKKLHGLAHNFPLIPPAFVNKTQAAFVLGSVTFLKRAMHAKLLTVIRQGGRGCSTLFDYASVLKVADFIRAGGQLPLLPSERLHSDNSQKTGR